MAVKSHNGSKHAVSAPSQPTEWEKWMARCQLKPEQARYALGLSNGTFYRRLGRAPTVAERLAMAAIYHRINPWR